MARTEVHGTFSQFGPRRPASAGRLARTLGVASYSHQFTTICKNMKYASTFLGLLSAILLSSCASPPPPVASKHFFVETQAFTPIFFASVDGNPKKILHKGGARPYEGESEPLLWQGESLVVADTGVYVVDWNPQSATLQQKLYLKKSDLSRVRIEITKRSILPNSAAIAIDARGQTYKFGVNIQDAKGIEVTVSDLIAQQ